MIDDLVALSHLLLVGSGILFRACPVAETALALGGSLCHRLPRLIDLDSALGTKLLRLPYPKHCMSQTCNPEKEGNNRAKV